MSALVIPGLTETQMARISRVMDLVEVRLEEVTNCADEELNLRTGHLLQAGGKRLRPALVALCGLLDENTAVENLVSLGVLVELTHLATLYHDDVMDDAPKRRGVASAHQIFGNLQAILTGDLLLARATQVAVPLGIKVVELHTNTYDRLCQGQLHETIGARPDEDPLKHHLQVLADKTGSLIAVSARYGAWAAGQSEEVQEALAVYGEKIGVAFQIADDVIDLSANPELTGKTPGTDLREGVVTMPVLLLKRDLAEGKLDKSGVEILRALGTWDLQDDERLQTVVKMIREHPVVAETKQMALKWANEAKEAIYASDVLNQSPVAQALVNFADMMVDRVA